MNVEEDSPELNIALIHQYNPLRNTSRREKKDELLQPVKELATHVHAGLTAKRKKYN